MDSASREFVRQRAGGRCEYCHLPEECDEWPFHIEHVIAKQHGGTDAADNLCWSCSRCNLYKGPNIASRDSETGKLVALYNPRQQNWADYFVMHDAAIVGINPVGRVTANLLQMNARQRIDLRRDLIARGVFSF